MELNIDEALRYLGVKADPDGYLHEQMTALATTLRSRIQPRSAWALICSRSASCSL